MRSSTLLLAGASMALSASCTDFLFTGSNESGAEFGETNLPGTLGTDYTFPDTDAIDVSPVNHTAKQQC